MRKLLFFVIALMVLVACGGKKVQEHTADRAVNTTTNDTITTTNNTSITAPTIINDTTIRKYYHKNETEDCTRFMEFEYYMPQLNKVAEDSIWRTITCSLCKTDVSGTYVFLSLNSSFQLRHFFPNLLKSL